MEATERKEEKETSTATITDAPYPFSLPISTCRLDSPRGEETICPLPLSLSSSAVAADPIFTAPHELEEKSILLVIALLRVLTPSPAAAAPFCVEIIRGILSMSVGAPDEECNRQRPGRRQWMDCCDVTGGVGSGGGGRKKRENRRQVSVT